MYNPQVQPIGAQLLSRAFENLGNNISDGIKEYKAKKEQDAAITGTLEGMLSPQAVQQYSALDPEFAKSVEKFNSHSMNLKDKQMFLGKVGGYKATIAEQEKKKAQDLENQINQQRIAEMMRQNAMGQQQNTNANMLQQYMQGQGRGVMAPGVQDQFAQASQDPGIQAAMQQRQFGLNPGVMDSYNQTSARLAGANARAANAENKNVGSLTYEEAVARAKDAQANGFAAKIVPKSGNTFDVEQSTGHASEFKAEADEAVFNNYTAAKKALDSAQKSGDPAKIEDAKERYEYWTGRKEHYRLQGQKPTFELPPEEPSFMDKWFGGGSKAAIPQAPEAPQAPGTPLVQTAEKLPANFTKEMLLQKVKSREITPEDAKKIAKAQGWSK